MKQPKIFGGAQHLESTISRAPVRFPVTMKDAIDTAMENTGIPSRKLSQWVSEAITSLEKQDGYWNLIAEECMSSGKTMSRTFTLSDEAGTALMNMMTKTQLEYPPEENKEMQEIQSKVIRTAMLQRLLE